MNEIKLSRELNGFVISWEDELDDGTKQLVSKVFEDKSDLDTDQGELMALKDLFLEVKEQLGYFYSKHNSFNLTIEVEENKNNE